jgi:hypothetical protein
MGPHVSIPDVEPDTEQSDPTEAIRIFIIMVGLAINVIMVWDYMKERPEVMVLRSRFEKWWENSVTNRERKARALRLAEGETVFEAITIVEGTDGRD